MRYAMGSLVGLVLLGSCDDRIDLDPYADAPPVAARVRPPAILGGTLAIIDGHAVAADPDRDAVYVVDIATRELLHTIALGAGDMPGRIAAGTEGRAHVVLRGSGELATIDLASGDVTRTAVCREPRGVSTDLANDRVYVACAEGSLVSLGSSDAAVLERTDIEADARDVIVRDGKARVSTFRDVRVVQPDGTEFRADRFHPTHAPTAALRLQEHPSETGMVVLHQLSSMVEVPLQAGPGGDGRGSDLPYGGGGPGCEPGLVVPVVTMLYDDRSSEQIPLGTSPSIVDVAFAPRSGMIAAAMPGVADDEPSVRVFPPGGSPCTPEPEPSAAAGVTAQAGQITSVAYTDDDTLVMFSREPARMLFSSDGAVEAVDLGGESRFDTGHEIFHRVTESGLACASCHPEGTDDGHVWVFETFGARRTQPLDVSLVDTAPFHWSGDMADLDTIMSEVLAHRMGGERQSPARAASFRAWLFEQARPPVRIANDADQVANGEALFTSYGCQTCHYGPELGGSNTETFAGQRLQVPTLRRVSLRPPFMHDGRSATLEDAVWDMLAGTRDTKASPADVDALVAYLRTL